MNQISKINLISTLIFLLITCCETENEDHANIKQLTIDGNIRLCDVKNNKIVASRDDDIWVFNISNRSWKQLTNDSDGEDFQDNYPSFSPSADSVVFSRNYRQIWKASVDGNYLSQLPINHWGISDLKWSPTGKYILISSKGRGTSSESDSLYLYSIWQDSLIILGSRLSFGAVLESTNEIKRYTDIVWNPDGTHLIFCDQDMLRQYSISDHSIQDITYLGQKGSCFEYHNFRISPDGHKYAFIFYYDTGVDGWDSTFVYTDDSFSKYELPSIAAHNWNVNWLNNSHVTCVSLHEVWSINIDDYVK